MDHPLATEQQKIAIEDALHTYPLASMPRDITLDVMSRIQSVPMPRPFQLGWHDLLLVLILSVCAAAIWFSVHNLPPIVVAQIRKGSILFYQYMFVNARWLTPVISFTLAGFFAALTIPYLRQELTKKSA